MQSQLLLSCNCIFSECENISLNVVSFSTAGFQPHTEMRTAHHMLLFGCSVPGEVAWANNEKFWYVCKYACITQ